MQDWECCGQRPLFLDFLAFSEAEEDDEEEEDEKEEEELKEEEDKEFDEVKAEVLEGVEDDEPEVEKDEDDKMEHKEEPADNMEAFDKIVGAVCWHFFRLLWHFLHCL